MTCGDKNAEVCRSDKLIIQVQYDNLFYVVRGEIAQH